MKPPFIKITATCQTHGRFMLERKPNKRTENIGDRHGLYDAVVCDKCRMWATIEHQELITAAPTAATNNTGTLPGLEG